MASSSNNASIAPVNVTWEMEAEFQLDYSGLSAAAMDGTYMTFSNEDQSVLYYFWHDLDAAGTGDPAPVGRTAIEVEPSTGDSATVMATDAAAALDLISGITATSSGSVVNVKLDAIGRAEDPADVDSGLAVTICRRGKNLDLGLLEGDVEFNVSPSNLILTSHQSGLTPRAALFQGFETLEVSTVLQETIDSKLSEIYGVYGVDSWVPAAGTEVYGGGTSRNGENLLIDAGRLVLKPVNASDDLSNTSLMLALPIPDTLVYSGENLKTLSVTWQGFVDDTKDSRVSAYLFGDQTQAGLDI